MRRRIGDAACEGESRRNRTETRCTDLPRGLQEVAVAVGRQTTKVSEGVPRAPDASMLSENPARSYFDELSISGMSCTA